MSRADPGYYFLGPSGDFETSLTGWTAKGGPKIVSGNESYHVNSPTDSHSLFLPNGSSITSPSICVSLDTPDLRPFVLSTGQVSATLNVKNQTWVTFTFVPVGTKGKWQIDDFYVDPVKHH